MMGFGDFRRRCRQSFWLAGIGALALVALAAGVRYLAGPVLRATPVVTFYPAIAIATYIGDRRAGLIAAAASVLVALFLFVEPAASFSTADIQDLYGVIAFGLASIFTVEIIAWINRIQDRLEATARENQVLFLELRHRVANNLQTVASLLALHRSEFKDPDARKVMENAINRVRLIGDIHRTIYQPTSESVDAGDFLTRFCKNFSDSLSAAPVKCRIMASAAWKPEVIVSIALLLHELLSNAVEHGIFGQADGKITVSFEADADGGRILTVEDNGAGMPPRFDPAASDRLGLKLVRLFAQQLRAEVRWLSANGSGTRVTVAFPAK